jgi:hypothetical protein
MLTHCKLSCLHRLFAKAESPLCDNYNIALRNQLITVKRVIRNERTNDFRGLLPGCCLGSPLAVIIPHALRAGALMLGHVHSAKEKAPKGGRVPACSKAHMRYS